MRLAYARLAMLTCLGVMTCQVAQAGVEQLYGTWAGTWYVDEQFIGDRVPYGSPPSPSPAIEFVLHAYAPSDHYGAMSVTDAQSGIVDLLTFDGVNVGMVVHYPMGTLPGDYGDLVGTLAGQTITGRYDERAPADPGWINWRGPVSISQVVPEPSTLAVLGTGAAFLVAYLARRRRA